MRLEDSPLNSIFFFPFPSSPSTRNTYTVSPSDLKSHPLSFFPSHGTATMSSDSDEDELLQMALKEQAQRDVNYGGKSSSNSRKPVANYVQPLKKPAPPPKQSLGKGRVAADDDDSEIEMLSISSGDEDNVQYPVAASRNKGATAAAAGRPVREDDRTWDGEEPSRWKHVDEAEVRDNRICQRFAF